MLERYYLTVEECKLDVWRKVNSGQFHALRRIKDKGNKEDDYKAFTILYDNFIEAIGLRPEYKEYLEMLQERIEVQLEYVKSLKEGIRDRFLLNKIKLLTAKIEKIQNQGGEGMTTSKVLLRLSKMQGYHIKETEITVLEYFDLLNDYNNSKDGRE